MPDAISIFISKTSIMIISIAIAANIYFRIDSICLHVRNRSHQDQIHQKSSSNRGSRSNTTGHTLDFKGRIPLYAAVIQNQIRCFR